MEYTESKLDELILINENGLKYVRKCEDYLLMIIGFDYQSINKFYYEKFIKDNMEEIRESKVLSNKYKKMQSLYNEILKETER